jgi:hypothetical protein
MTLEPADAFSKNLKKCNQTQKDCIPLDYLLKTMNLPEEF